jgi:hypothetical protein
MRRAWHPPRVLPSAVALASSSPVWWCSRPFRWPPPGPRCRGGQAAGLAWQGAGPRLGRPHQRPDPRSSGGAGPPPGHHRDGDRPQVLGPRGSNGPQLGPRLTAGRPADAPGGLTLTPGLPTDRRRRWRDCDVACRSRQARRASATATCPPHPGGRRRRIPGDDLSHDRQKGGAPAWCASPDTHIAFV